MRNEDYCEYIKKKPFNERFRAFGDAVESMTRNGYKSSESGIGNENRQWYLSESKAQGERADFLFKNLIEDYESKGE